jgi:protein-tyrosine phosphatase
VALSGSALERLPFFSGKTRVVLKESYRSIPPMVDIHCHILPGVDDGSRSWEMTREMCRIAADDGVRHIVATPHCNDEYAYDRQRYEGLKSQLEEAAEGRIEFSIGCDFHFSYENITDAIANPQRYSINGTRYLLIEFSDYGIPPNVAELLFQLTSRGMVPIVTHPERNPLLVRRPEKVLELIDAGALVQVTANSITGFWGAKTKQVAEWLLAQGAVHVVASDAHDPRRRRPVLSEARNALARLVGLEIADALVNDNPLAIVEGRPLLM